MLHLLSTQSFNGSKLTFILSLALTPFLTQASEQFSFSYTFDASARGTPGEILSGVVEGRLAEDGDTILIDRFIQADLSGIRYNISGKTDIRAADPEDAPRMSLSGETVDFWVCAEGFDGFDENGGGDCAFGDTGGFLISPYLDTQTAECIQFDDNEECVNWAWAGIPEKTNAYRVGDIPSIKNNWQASKLQPSNVGEVVHTFGDVNKPVLFSFDREGERYVATALDNAFSVTWQGSYSQVSLYMLPDMNGNGSPEIGLFGIRSSTGNEGKPQLSIKDTATGNKVSILNWVVNWSNTSIVVLPDMTGDGVADIGLQGLFKEGLRPQLVVRNGLMNGNVNTFAFPALWNKPTYFSFTDVDLDGTNEVALFGTISKNGKPQVRVINGTTPSDKFSAYTFPDNWNNTSWHNVGDFNMDGAPDWALFGKANADGRWQLIIKSGLSPRGALSIYAWPDLTDIIFGQFDDYTNDGIAEFALGGFSADKNRWQLQIKDGQDRNSTLNNVSWANKWSDVSLHILQDVDGDGLNDLALLGKRTNYEIALKSSRDGFSSETILDLGSTWQVKPNIGFIATSTNEPSEFMAYDVVNQVLHVEPITFPLPEILNYVLTIDFVITSQQGSICNTDEEYVGLEGSEVGELTLDEFAQRAVLTMDIEGEGTPTPISGNYNSVEQTIDLIYENDVFDLSIASKTDSNIEITGTITTTDTRGDSAEQCVTVWDLDIKGAP